MICGAYRLLSGAEYEYATRAPPLGENATGSPPTTGSTTLVSGSLGRLHL